VKYPVVMQVFDCAKNLQQNCFGFGHSEWMWVMVVYFAQIIFKIFKNQVYTCFFIWNLLEAYLSELLPTTTSLSGTMLGW
jgi:hypothetical protein